MERKPRGRYVKALAERVDLESRGLRKCARCSGVLELTYPYLCCEPCRESQRQAQQERRARLRAEGGKRPPAKPIDPYAVNVRPKAQCARCRERKSYDTYRYCESCQAIIRESQRHDS